MRENLIIKDALHRCTHGEAEQFTSPHYGDEIYWDDDPYSKPDWVCASGHDHRFRFTAWLCNLVHNA